MSIKTKKLALLPLTLSLLLSACGGDKASSTTVVEPAITQNNKVSSADQIIQSAKDVADRSAKWQIAQLGNLHYIPESHRAKSENAKFWIQAAFNIGLMRWTDATGNQEYLAHLDQMAKREKFDLLQDRPYHADDHTIAQTYIWLAEQTGNKDAIKPTQKLFDWILDNRKDQVSLEMLDSTASGHGEVHLEGNCQTRWCWADALFMAPRAWIQLSNATGDPKYTDYADKEFWASADYLFSDHHGLFFRDSRYFDMKNENGNPVFWGRGNGWVFAAIPLIIDELPENHPSKARYIELYKKNAAGLLTLQRENGFWPVSLKDPEIVKTPEVSGTGFITFGLAWGVNNGILTEPAYKESVEKGWQALSTTVAQDGRVNWVQHVGKSPDPVKETDSQLYGTGAVLLAASEMIKWTDK